MNLGQAISSVFRQYFVFSGRACRSEYWWFFLFNFIVGIVLSLIFPVLYVIWVIGTIIPGFAVLDRRLHDTGRSGWWFFIGLIPIIGTIALLIFLVTEGDRGENRYGPDPLRPPIVMGINRVEGNRSYQDEGRFYTNCGSALESSAKFCRACGTAV